SRLRKSWAKMARLLPSAPSARSSTATAMSPAPVSSPIGQSRRSTARLATTHSTSKACLSMTRSPLSPTTAHVIDSSTGESIPGLYATGWIKRGPVGLIGNTKSDAKDTTAMLIEDYLAGKLTAADKRDPEAIINLLE